MEQKARRSSAIKSAVQQYQKDFPKQRIGVENGQYDSALFKKAVVVAFESGRSVQCAGRCYSEMKCIVSNEAYYNFIGLMGHWWMSLIETLKKLVYNISIVSPK